MKISIFLPQALFSAELQNKLSLLGGVVYIPERKEYSLDQLLQIAADSDIIGIDPDAFGGFEKARGPLMKVIESLPNLNGISLSTTSFGWIDLEYCKKRNLPVSNIPGYSRESVAEHALALLLCVAKRIIVSDRRTQRGEYKMEMGFELKGKTLGIIGLGNIGSRVAELGLGVGMRVIAYNRTPTSQSGVEMKTLDEVLQESDAISLNATHESGNTNMIAKEQIIKMKNGVIVVNTVDRELVNEQDMADAIKSEKIYGYAYEAEDLEHTPLAGLENAIGIKGFAWYTKEALENLNRIFVDNIEHIAKGMPQNLVNS